MVSYWNHLTGKGSAVFGWLKDEPTSSAFASFDNEAVTHILQRSQYPLSFACNFCPGLTFASDFLRSRSKYPRLYSRHPENCRAPQESTGQWVGSAQSWYDPWSWLARLVTFAVRVLATDVLANIYIICGPMTQIVW